MIKPALMSAFGLAAVLLLTNSGSSYANEERCNLTTYTPTTMIAELRKRNIARNEIFVFEGDEAGVVMDLYDDAPAKKSFNADMAVSYKLGPTDLYIVHAWLKGLYCGHVAIEETGVEKNILTPESKALKPGQLLTAETNLNG